jgi:hypothetical protein
MTRKNTHTRRFLGPVVVLGILMSLAAMFALPALASPAEQQTVPNGTVVQLSGTPHLWISDDQGMLHWGGDTRALGGRYINWGDVRLVSPDQLKAFRIGDPWLSSGLLKIGDPIYLVKWETNEAQPRLFHIQSIADVEIFGINATNYGRFVMDRASWERQFLFNVDTLQRLELAPAIGPTPTATAVPAAATATATPTTLKAREVSVNRTDTNSYETTIEVTGAPPGQRLTVKLDYEEWSCSPGCDSTTKGSWGPLDAGPANSSGVLRYVDRHGAYKTYTYTFTAVNGATATVTIGDDLNR